MLNQIEKAIHTATTQELRDFTEEEKQYIFNNESYRKKLLFWFGSNNSDGCWTRDNVEFMDSLYPVKEEDCVDLNQNRVDIIAQEIREKLNPATIIDSNLAELIKTIAELWDHAPGIARRMEKSLIAYADKAVLINPPDFTFELESKHAYAHPDFVWSGRYFLFSAADPRIRSVEINAQCPQLFPDRQRIVIYQSQNEDGSWNPALLGFPDRKVGKEGLGELIALLELGELIIKNADSFFCNPKNCLETRF